MPPTYEPPGPFANLIGLEVAEMGEGSSTATLDAQERHLNPYGYVHGAVAYALVDTSMGGALSSMAQEGESFATLEIKISYLRPATMGQLRCETRVLHKSRRFSMLESQVKQGEDVVATASGTFAIIPGRE